MKATIARLFILLFAGLDADAASVTENRYVTSPVKTHSLAPFTFHSVPSWSRDSDLYKQKAEPVCLHLLAYLNHPRSNTLFKPDGTLVRFDERITSVTWETLDKDQYREGYLTLLKNEHPSVQAQYLMWFANPEWVLQRTLAHPQEDFPKPNRLERWLYRLALGRPYTRIYTDMYTNPTGFVELPIWFPSNTVEWLGNLEGKRNPKDSSGKYGGQQQWITHGGQSYALSNSTYGDGKGAVPHFLRIDLYQLILGPEGHSFLRQTCALRAINKE